MGEAGQVVGPRVGLVGPPIVDRSNILCHFGSRDIRLRIVDTSRNFDPPTHTWWTLVRPGTTGAAKKLFGNNGEILEFDMYSHASGKNHDKRGSRFESFEDRYFLFAIGF